MPQFLVFRDSAKRQILIDVHCIKCLYEHPNGKETFMYFESHVLLIEGALKDIWSLIEGALESEDE